MCGARPPLRRRSPVPHTESLKDTIARALPYYEAEIVPALKAGERVLVAAHGNSMRGIIKHLSNIGDDEIVGVEIPTGQPLVYELDDDLSVDADCYYLSERDGLRPAGFSARYIAMSARAMTALRR